jgi:hypothetical protein
MNSRQLPLNGKLTSFSRPSLSATMDSRNCSLFILILDFAQIREQDGGRRYSSSASSPRTDVCSTNSQGRAQQIIARFVPFAGRCNQTVTKTAKATGNISLVWISLQPDPFFIVGCDFLEIEGSFGHIRAEYRSSDPISSGTKTFRPARRKPGSRNGVIGNQGKWNEQRIRADFIEFGSRKRQNLDRL